MKTRMIAAACVILVGATLATQADEGRHRLGLGVNYWTSVKDTDVRDINKDGLGYVFNYQYRPGLIGLGIDHELLPDRFGKDAYAPQAYLIVGKGIYAGAGVGIVYTDGKFADKPFFSLRAGLDFEVLPSVHLDLYGQYRFESKQDLDNEATNIDTDTVFLGAAVRLEL